MATTPTLKTIEKLINSNHTEVQSRLLAVEEQVKLTNGRVKALETAEAVAQGIKEFQEAQSSSNPKLDARLVWLVPLLIAIVSGFYWLGTKLG